MKEMSLKKLDLKEIRNFILIFIIGVPVLKTLFSIDINNGSIVYKDMTGIKSIIFITIIWIILYEIIKTLIKNNIVRLEKKDINLIVIGIIISRLIVYIGYYLLKYTYLKDHTLNDYSLMGVNYDKSFILMFFVIYTPIMEEFLYRYVIIDRIFKFKKISIIVSSFIFAIVHIPNDIISFSIYFILGIILGFSYWKTKNLGVSISIHMLENLIALWTYFI